MRRILTVGLALVILLIFMGSALATVKTDVSIDFADDVGELLLWADKGDVIEVNVTSDNPVDVYIMKSDDYWDATTNLLYDDYVLARENITSTSFTYTIPDDDTYYLVISNLYTSKAVVDYEFTDNMEDELDEAISAGILAGTICILGGLAVVVVIIIVIVLVICSSDKKRAPVYPQQSYVTPPTMSICPTCGQQARYIAEYGKNYCDNCKRYL